MGDAVVLLVGHQTCDSHVVSSRLGWATPVMALSKLQATYTCVPLSPSSIIWYGQGAVVLFDWEGRTFHQALLTESNFSSLLGV